MSNMLQGIVYLTPEQYETLLNDGVITVNGKTIAYNKNTLYITKASNKPSNAEVLIGNTAPTDDVVAVLGQLYLDSTEKKLYQCVDITTEIVSEVEVTKYEWKQIGVTTTENGTIDLTGYATEEYVTTSISGKAEQSALDAVINNETQLNCTSYSSFRQGNALKTASQLGVVHIGYNSGSKDFGAYRNVAVGYEAKTPGRDSSCRIQIGTGANELDNTLQIFADNIYNHNTHTLTVQNIDLNGTDINTVTANAIYNNLYVEGENLLINTLTIPETDDVDGSLANPLDDNGNMYSIELQENNTYIMDVIVEGKTYRVKGVALPGSLFEIENLIVIAFEDTILADGSILWWSAMVSTDPENAITSIGARSSRDTNITPEVQITSIKRRTNLIVNKTSELVNDMGYLTLRDLNQSTVSVGGENGESITLEEVANKATNSIQPDDAASKNDIDGLFD